MFALASTLGNVASASDAPECKPFPEIYANGKEICERMWGESYVYTPDEANAYTMWFFDATNPNNDISRKLGNLGPNEDHSVCHIRWKHKEEPSPEPDTFTECLPWKSESCCHEERVSSVEQILKNEGDAYRWDRCGPLTPECERFFVQQKCFYECEPNTGFYRKYPEDIFNESNPDHKRWKMAGMPIKASYCDAWWQACRHDNFCSADSGNYFTCGNMYKAHDAAKVLTIVEEETPLETYAMIGVLSFSIVCCASCMAMLIVREKAGKPVFGRLKESSQSSGTVIGGMGGRA